ncbi:MAG: peptidylprolyl isomerase [Candidatus Paceibacterota bacterium]
MTETKQNIILETNLGNIEISLLSSQAPKTVANFIKLAKDGFYENTKFHRVIKGFMIQGGDPYTKGEDTSVYGTGGPGYKFADEQNDLPMVRGMLAMANSGPNTNGSQFFIITANATPWLVGKHTVFGQVVSGMEIVDKIENLKVDANDLPLSSAIIQKITIQ